MKNELSESITTISAFGKWRRAATSLVASIARKPIFEAFLSDDPDAALMHGPTYMASPLACAAANASLDLFEQEDRLGQIAAIESHFQSVLAGCADLPGVTSVRIKGAIAAIELAELNDADRLKARFIDAGLWIRPIGNVVYLTPSFVIGEEDLSELTCKFVAVMRDWCAEYGEDA